MKIIFTMRTDSCPDVIYIGKTTTNDEAGTDFDEIKRALVKAISDSDWLPAPGDTLTIEEID